MAQTTPTPTPTTTQQVYFAIPSGLIESLVGVLINFAIFLFIVKMFTKAVSLIAR
jgi:hypothetical protein